MLYDRNSDMIFIQSYDISSQCLKDKDESILCKFTLFGNSEKKDSKQHSLSPL